MNENNIILKLKNKIFEFDIRNFDTVTELKIIQDKNKRLNIFMNFEYKNYKENKKIYNIGIYYINVRINHDIGLDLINVLHQNKMNIINVSKDQLEGINWKIIDEDDDGNINYEIYCEDIKLKYIK